MWVSWTSSSVANMRPSKASLAVGLPGIPSAIVFKAGRAPPMIAGLTAIALSPRKVAELLLADAALDHHLRLLLERSLALFEG